MEIVINVPEEDYEYLKSHNGGGLYNAILNGTPLPKGHGRLIDVDVLKGELDTITEWNGDVHRYVTEKGIDYAPTIIEADTESEVKK